MRWVVLAFGLGGCGPTLVSLQVGGQALQVEVADDADERARGLMFRDSMPSEQGMVFVYEDEKPRSFWMKDTRIPLSIAYVDGTGKIVKIADMKPFDTNSVPSLYPAKYAIETNAGWFAAHGISEGAKVEGLQQLKRAD